MTFEEIAGLLPVSDQKTIKGMMSLFETIDIRTQKFAQQTGLRCKAGCGACCANPDIETTVAEVLPLAVHLWCHSLTGGRIKQNLCQARNRESGPPLRKINRTCIFYEPDPNDFSKGRCGVYAFRPGICRLFGFSARHDKYGKPVLVTCKVIKDSQAAICKAVGEKLNKGSGEKSGTLDAPLLGAHAFAVADIDPVHGKKLLPINQAVQKAIEKIGYSMENRKQK